LIVINRSFKAYHGSSANMMIKRNQSQAIETQSLANSIKNHESVKRFSVQDAHYMAQALRLAERGLFTVRPNPAVGCVIVRDGVVVGEGWHIRAGEPHAEVYALRAAAEQARGATAYVTLEPCSHHGRTPPCCDALIAAGVARVVVAMQDPNPQVAGRGLARLRHAGIDVTVGLMADSARALNLGFLSRLERNRPFVRVKLAASLDGRTALDNGQSKWITGEAARHDVQNLRARSGAILTGVDTVIIDDPLLTVRLPEFALFQPLRVIADSQLRSPVAANLFTTGGKVLIVICQTLLDSGQEAEKIALLQDKGIEVIAMPCLDGRLDLDALLFVLAQDYQINDLMVEAGATLAGAFVTQKLADELWWYAAPCMMGHQARAGLILPDHDAMSDVAHWTLFEQRQIGKDWRFKLKP
jgi:diaminohydroxyphosphoribosylaminopyrimidine deaminase/5-amino-6-(5-phosphoribosylamino)uracil reductase